MSIGTAFRAFFAALTNREVAAGIDSLLRGDKSPSSPRIEQSSPKGSAQPTLAAAPSRQQEVRPVRSEAIALLAMLQRESRLVDLIQEPLEQFSDAQVGAAARPCLQQCRKTLARVFDVQPLLEGGEGTRVEVPAGASPLRYQWVGNAPAGGNTSMTGQLVHPGWQARKGDLGQWTGDPEDANVIAAAQIQHP